MESSDVQKKSAVASPGFFGWIVLIGATVAQIGGQFGGWAVTGLQPAMLTQTLWSRESIGLGASLRSVATALTAPIMGRLLDRYGPRVAISGGAIISALGLFLIGFVNDPTQFVLLFGLVFGVGYAFTSALPMTTTARKWFFRRGSLAVSLVQTGGGVAAIGVPLLGLGLAGSYGWRAAFQVIAGILLVFCVVGAFFMRKSPESMGQYPDGEKPDPEAMRKVAEFESSQAVWTIGQALRTPAFWLLVATNVLMQFAYIALVTNAITWAILDLKIDRNVVTSVWSLTYVGVGLTVGLLFTLVVDQFIDRIGGRKPILIITSAIMGVSLLYALQVTEAIGFGAFLVLLALGGTPWQRFNITYMGDLFGTRNMGTVYGAVTLFVMIGTFSGPWVYGRSHDMTGSYNTAFIITAIACFVATACYIFMKPPKPAPAQLPQAAHTA